MTRNRDSMSMADMVRVCALSGVAIVGVMVLLGVMMIAQKPEARLELASLPTVAEPISEAIAHKAARAVIMAEARVEGSALR